MSTEIIMTAENNEIPNSPYCADENAAVLPGTVMDKSEGLTAFEVYQLTAAPENKKMKDAVGQRLEVTAWAIYCDENKKTGELMDVLSVLTSDGDVYATNSPTCIGDFSRAQRIARSMGASVDAIEVISGISNKGREFITCKWVQ